MNDRRPLVDVIAAVETARPAARAREATPADIAVRLAGGEVARLDAQDPRTPIWRQVLESLRASGAPAYLEIDERTGAIAELLLPLAVGVESIAPARDGDGVDVALVISHARHYLRRSNARYAEILKTLESAARSGARLLVTETQDTHEIIDARPDTYTKPGRGATRRGAA